MTAEEMIEIVEDKEKYHREAYLKYVTDNPGYAMNGHLIKADTCREILETIKIK